MRLPHAAGAEVGGGVRLALDWGKARIGVAACDAAGVLAYPVETIDTTRSPLARIRVLVAEYEPTAVILGLPLTLAGAEGPAALAIRERAAEVSAAVAPIPVVLVDERLSTASASKRLQAVGRNTRKQRSVVDQVAAVTILESVLDAERAGRHIGEEIPIPGTTPVQPVQEES